MGIAVQLGNSARALGQGLLAWLGAVLAPPVCLACRAPLRLAGPAAAWVPCAPPPDPPSSEAATLVAPLLPPGLVCGRCAGALEPIGAACLACGRSRGPFADRATRCRACRREPRGFVRQTVALFRYRRVGRRLLHRLKYSGAEELAEPLGLALGRRASAALGPLPADLVVCAVPLHLLRRLSRGFDQAGAIAEGVAAALERPLVRALRRRRRTVPLFRLPHEAREPLVADAFQVRDPGAIRGRPVLLVDDIRTSGATLRAAAEALMRAGAGRITAAVVAR